MTKKILSALIPVIIIGIIPVFFSIFTVTGENSGNVTVSTDDVLVIYTPHPESIRREVGGAFCRFYKEKTGRSIKLDFRSPGGTTDIVNYINDRFTNAFRKEWEASGREWNDAVANGFRSSSPDLDGEAALARKMFLESSVSIDADLFWGGGTYDHGKNKSAGYAVDGGIAALHPEYFTPDAMRQEISGEAIYDPDGCFYGVCLSSFGIACNRTRLEEAGLKTPERWSDLARPEFFDRLALADPTKSGSVAKCYELIIQQAMAERIAAGGTPAEGWQDGMNIIRQITANSSLISDSASMAVNHVASGEAVCGIGIDFYVSSAADWQEKEGAVPPPLFYVTPYRGSTVSADPVQLLRGAPARAAAQEFISFLLSLEGQKIYAFKTGTPGGPVQNALRRAPVRLELYSEEWKSFRSDPDYDPISAASDVVYHYEWTGKYFGLIRVVIRCCMLDIQPELRRTWQEIIAAGGPEAVPEAMEAFTRMPFSYQQADEAADALWVREGNDIAAVTALRRQWTVQARQNCLEALELARQKR